MTGTTRVIWAAERKDKVPGRGRVAGRVGGSARSPRRTRPVRRTRGSRRTDPAGGPARLRVGEARRVSHCLTDMFSSGQGCPPASRAFSSSRTAASNSPLVPRVRWRRWRSPSTRRPAVTHTCQRPSLARHFAVEVAAGGSTRSTPHPGVSSRRRTHQVRCARREPSGRDAQPANAGTGSPDPRYGGSTAAGRRPR